jgi:hypothetical protein
MRDKTNAPPDSVRDLLNGRQAARLLLRPRLHLRSAPSSSTDPAASQATGHDGGSTESGYGTLGKVKVRDIELRVIGGTGLIGSKVVRKPTAAGHPAVPAALSTGRLRVWGASEPEAAAKRIAVQAITG